MPSPIARVCSTPGCPNISISGPCPSCRKQKDQRRGSASQRGYGDKWAKTSQALRRTHLRWCGDRMPGAPYTEDSTCPKTGFKRVIAQVVDHIIPVSGPHDPRFWDKTNWQGLCHLCHNRKRNRESRVGGGGV